MQRTNQQLREDALAIWRAGVAAVDSVRLVLEHVHTDGDLLHVGDEQFSLRGVRRLLVVGAGKAGAGMADGLEQALGDRLLSAKDVTGWINVPANCLRPLRRIHLHAARPAGVNEPTEEGVAGAERILQLVADLTPQDLCLCLISGGGSALLPAPAPGITLADKQALTRHLSAAGANIQELNTVRKQLSRIKGGGLARACRAANLVTLIISDVLGDPLDVIASGPTVPDRATAQDALEVLDKYHTRDAGISPSIFDVLQASARQSARSGENPSTRVSNLVIGNNATAVDAAGIEAERRGYSHAMFASRQLEGPAEDVGRHHAQIAWRMRHEAGPDCLITGGEPTVHLVPPDRRGLGGRNQQLVLAALEQLLDISRSARPSFNPQPQARTEPARGLSFNPQPQARTDDSPLNGIALLSGGTDGEDGPTDAAGALIDDEIYQKMRAANQSPTPALQRNDAYHFFQPLGGLIQTGPTHTNVCDLRVVVTSQVLAPSASPTGRVDP